MTIHALMSPSRGCRRRNRFMENLQGIDARTSLGTANGSDDENKYKDSSKSEAERLMAKAKAIRDSIPTTNEQPAGSDVSIGTSATHQDTKQSIYSLPPHLNSPGDRFRLYIDVGREKGTWMDPRWGASGRRIEFTIDVSFPVERVQAASSDIAESLLKSATSKSLSVSPVYNLNYAPSARLRGGFDKMAIRSGGFCIESSASGKISSSSTLRFCLSVDGTLNNFASYGDVSVPEGCLFFALPYFGTRTNSASDGKSMALSKKEGAITVKQMGWNTGWWREESRILGVFRAVPLEEARRRDKF
eukprot:g140.t2 g140   contig1:336916-337824(-)